VGFQALIILGFTRKERTLSLFTYEVK
jgi:hypothetical protein